MHSRRKKKLAKIREEVHGVIRQFGIFPATLKKKLIKQYAIEHDFPRYKRLKYEKACLPNVLIAPFVLATIDTAVLLYLAFDILLAIARLAVKAADLLEKCRGVEVEPDEQPDPYGSPRPCK